MNWPLIRLLAISTDLLTRTFLAFYIWEHTHDLHLILFFGLIYFASIPLTSIAAGFITDQFDIKIPLLLGVWIQMIQMVFIITTEFPPSEFILILIALTGGISEAFRNIALHAIEFGVQEQKNITHYYANKTLLTKLFELVLPLSAAFLITYTGGGFDLLFVIVIGILILKTIMIVLYKIPRAQNTFDIKNILTFPGTNKDKITLVKGVFIEGLSEGITLTILPIIVLTFAESILKWGIVNTGIVLAGTLISLFLTQWANDINSKTLYALGAFLFAGASTFFLAQFNFLVVILFLIANELMQVIKEISYNSSVERIMEEDRREYHLYTEYEFLVETVTSFGRLVPVIILLATGISIDDPLTLRVTLMVIGILPLITLSVLGKSRIFHSQIIEPKISSIRSEIAPPSLTQTRSDSTPPPSLGG